MRSIDWVAAIAAVALGACCLLLAATGLSGSTWIPYGLRGPLLTWAPFACVLGVILILALIILPTDLYKRGRLPWAVFLLVLIGVAGLLGRREWTP